MRIMFSLLVAGSLIAYQVNEQYEGQREHAAPPADWYCEHQNVDLSVDRAHVCACERLCDETSGQVIEDRNCSAFCHASHCHCDVGNAHACK